MKQDERVQFILSELAAGKTRKEIATDEGKQWKSIDMYMRRNGFGWSTEQETYILKANEPETKLEEDVQTINTKAAQIVRMLDVKHPNIRQTASKQGFESVEVMGNYMKSQGYIWDDELNNYQYNEASKPVASKSLASLTLPVGALNEEAILQLLVRHQEKLLQLLQSEQMGSLQTYRFKGNKVNKTLTLASSVATLLEDYQKAYNITQRSIVETALAEFFERHGYEEQLRLATT